MGYLPKRQSIPLKHLVSKLKSQSSERQTLIDDIKKLSYTTDFTIIHNQQTNDYIIKNWRQEILLDENKAWTHYQFKASPVNLSRPQILKLVLETGMTPQTGEWVGKRTRISINKTALQDSVILRRLKPILDGDSTQNKWFVGLILKPADFKTVEGDTKYAEIDVWYGNREFPIEQATVFSLWGELTTVLYAGGIEDMDVKVRMVGDRFDHRKTCIVFDKQRGGFEPNDKLCYSTKVENIDTKSSAVSDSDRWGELLKIIPESQETTTFSVTVPKASAGEGIPLIFFNPQTPLKEKTGLTAEKPAK